MQNLIQSLSLFPVFMVSFYLMYSLFRMKTLQLSGRPSVNPLFFFTAKAILVFPLLGFLSDFFYIREGVMFLSQGFVDYIHIAGALLLLYGGSLLIILSLRDLGTSLRIGIHTENPSLKTSGIYSFSRNPMYLGVHVFNVSLLLLSGNLVLWLLWLYSVMVHHFIIANEEKDLIMRFPKDYAEYKSRVRPYFGQYSKPSKKA